MSIYSHMATFILSIIRLSFIDSFQSFFINILSIRILNDDTAAQIHRKSVFRTSFERSFWLPSLYLCARVSPSKRSLYVNCLPLSQLIRSFSFGLYEIIEVDSNAL